MNVKIVLFPDGEDPDSFARKYRRAELEELITTKAQDFIRFKTSLLLKEAASDPIKRAGLIKEIVSSISLIPDPIYRSVYIKECSTILEVQEQMLLSSLNKILYQRNRKEAEQAAARQEVDYQEMPAPKQEEQDDHVIENQEHHLIRLLLLYSNYEIVANEEDENGQISPQKISVARYIIEEINRDELKFSHSEYQKIFDLYYAALQEGRDPDEKMLILESQDQKLISVVITLISSQYELSENWLKNRIQVNSEKEKLTEAVETTLLSFKEKTIDRMINEILQAIKSSNNEEDIMFLQLKHKNLKDISRIINQKLGRIITK